MADPTIKIKFGIVNQATAELNKIHKQFESLTTSKGFQAAIMGVGVGAGVAAYNAAMGAIRGFGDSLIDAVKAAAEEEVGISRMDAALRANVAGWTGNTAAIEETIKARMKLGFTDDELRTSFGTLVGSAKDVNKAFALQAAAMDLARFKQISLDEASTALVRTEAGQYRMLATLGIKMKEGATQAEVLATVQRQLAGQAKAYAETSYGALQMVGVAWDELKENAVQAVLPLMKTYLPMLRDGINLLTDNVWALHAAFVALAAVIGMSLTVKLVGLITAFRELPVVAALAEASIKGVTASIVGLGIALSAGVIVAFLAWTQAVADAKAKADEYAGRLDYAATVTKRYAIVLAETKAPTREMADDTAAAGARIVATFEKLPRSALSFTEMLRTGVTSSVVQMKGDVVRTVDQMAVEAMGAGRRLASGLASGVISGIDTVANAAAQLDAALRYGLSQSQEKTRLLGVLASGTFQQGLASGIPSVIEATAQLGQGVVTMLQAVVGPAYASGVRTWLAYEQGLMLDERMTPGLEARIKAVQKAIDAAGAKFNFKIPNLDSIADQAAAALKKVGGAASDTADKIRDAIGKAFDRAGKSAKAYFDAVHQRNLRAIDDARKLADAQYELAVGKVDAAVQAYRDQLEAKRTAREEAELRAALTAATTDEERVRAEQALTDFLEDQTLARMEREADAEKDRLAAQKEAQDAQFDAAVENEDRIYDAKVAAWEKATAALQAALDKQTVSYATAAKQILAILKAAKDGYVATAFDTGAAVGGAIAAGISGASAEVQAAIDAMNQRIATMKPELVAGFQGVAAAVRGLTMHTPEYDAALTQAYAAIGWAPAAGYPGAFLPRATGGPIAPTGDYIVGEGGAERLTMRGGRGYVTPIEGGGAPVVVNLTVDGRTLATIVDEHLFYKYRTAARGGMA